MLLYLWKVGHAATVPPTVPECVEISTCFNHDSFAQICGGFQLVSYRWILFLYYVIITDTSWLLCLCLKFLCNEVLYEYKAASPCRLSPNSCFFNSSLSPFICPEMGNCMNAFEVTAAENCLPPSPFGDYHISPLYDDRLLSVAILGEL